MRVPRLLTLTSLVLVTGCSGGSAALPDATAIPGQADVGALADAVGPVAANDASIADIPRDTADPGALDSATGMALDSAPAPLPDVGVNDAFGAVSSDALIDTPAQPDANALDAPSVDAPVVSLDAIFTGGPDTAPGVLKPNVRVLTAVALNGATVGDTSIVLAKAGNEELATLPAGMVLGSFDGGFLRRVVSVTSDAATITIVTEDASLADVVEEGEIDTSFVFGTDGEPYQEVPVSDVDFAVDGGTFPARLYAPAPMPLSLGIDLSGKTLYSSGGISLVLTQASVKYVPTCTVRMSVKKSRIVSFSTALQGNLNMAFQPTLTASASYTTPTAKANLWTSPTYRFFQTIGALPVGEEVRLVLDGKINATASGKVSVSGGVEGGGKLSLGVTYRNGAWSVAASAPLNFSAIEPTASGEASLSYTVTITPRVEVVFFPLNKHLTNIGVSLYTDAASTLEGKLQTGKCPHAIDWKATMKLTGMGEANLSVLDRELLGYSRPVFESTLPLSSGSVPLDKCEQGETPHCGTVTQSFHCCPPDFPYFLDMNTIAGNGGCWQGAIEPSTITDCGDGQHHACPLGSGATFSCATGKCTKPSGS